MFRNKNYMNGSQCAAQLPLVEVPHYLSKMDETHLQDFFNIVMNGVTEDERVITPIVDAVIRRARGFLSCYKCGESGTMSLDGLAPSTRFHCKNCGKFNASRLMLQLPDLLISLILSNASAKEIDLIKNNCPIGSKWDSYLDIETQVNSQASQYLNGEKFLDVASPSLTFNIMSPCAKYSTRNFEELPFTEMEGKEPLPVKATQDCIIEVHDPDATPISRRHWSKMTVASPDTPVALRPVPIGTALDIPTPLRISAKAMPQSPAIQYESDTLDDTSTSDQQAQVIINDNIPVAEKLSSLSRQELEAKIKALENSLGNERIRSAKWEELAEERRKQIISRDRKIESLSKDLKDSKDKLSVILAPAVKPTSEKLPKRHTEKEITKQVPKQVTFAPAASENPLHDDMNFAKAISAVQKPNTRNSAKPTVHFTTPYQSHPSFQKMTSICVKGIERRPIGQLRRDMKQCGVDTSKIFHIGCNEKFNALHWFVLPETYKQAFQRSLISNNHVLGKISIEGEVAELPPNVAINLADTLMAARTNLRRRAHRLPFLKRVEAYVVELSSVIRQSNVRVATRC